MPADLDVDAEQPHDGVHRHLEQVADQVADGGAGSADEALTEPLPRQQAGRERDQEHADPEHQTDARPGTHRNSSRAKLASP